MKRWEEIWTRKCELMKEERQSNMELLRIIAMFMILVIHANLISIPRPEIAKSFYLPPPISMRYLIESLGIVGVNLFVLISDFFS